MNFFRCPRRRMRGLTLLEVSIAVVILALAVVGIFNLFLTTERMNIIAREEATALFAASEKINEIRAKPFSVASRTPDPTDNEIVADYYLDTFPVNIAGDNVPNQRLGTCEAPIANAGLAPDALMGNNGNEMGVVIIHDESPNEGNYGDTDGDGDLDFPVDLNLDGSFSSNLTANNCMTPTKDMNNTLTFPIDLGRDKTSFTDSFDPALGEISLMRLIPLAVVVRWDSRAGLPRRVQILTFITDREGSF